LGFPLLLTTFYLLPNFMEFVHTQKYLKNSPRKMREVVFLVKSLKPAEALEILPQIEKRAAQPLFKALKAAVANVKQTGVGDNEIELKAIEVNEGPKLKRFRAGARGRAKPYRKRWSHLKITLFVKDAKPIKKAKKSRKQVGSSQRTKSVRDDKSGMKSLSALSKEKIKKGDKRK